MPRSVGAVLGRIDGQVMGPGDDGYDAARTVWNAMVDRLPALVVRCASVPDVVAGVRAARERSCRRDRHHQEAQRKRA